MIPALRGAVLATGNVWLSGRLRALVAAQIRCTGSGQTVASPFATTNTNADGTPVNLTLDWVLPHNRPDGALSCGYFVSSATMTDSSGSVHVNHISAPFLRFSRATAAFEWPISAQIVQPGKNAELLSRSVVIPNGSHKATVIVQVEGSTGGSKTKSQSTTGTFILEVAQEGDKCEVSAEKRLGFAIGALTHHKKELLQTSLLTSSHARCSDTIKLGVMVGVANGRDLIVEGPSYSSVIVRFD